MKNTSKIGIFDSGLGGLFIAKSIREHLPDYDYIYLGDTLNVPYGNKSKELIYSFCEKAVSYLFSQDCELVIVACNTASANALRKLQQEYLPEFYPNRRILGVIVPTIEVATEDNCKNIGLIGTTHTVSSGIYKTELTKINQDINLHQIATPLLTPLIEYDGMKYIDVVLKDYLKLLKNKQIDSLILGCTHYSCLEEKIKTIFSESIKIINQAEIIPWKLEDYLNRHPEITSKLSKNKTLKVNVTELNPLIEKNIHDVLKATIEISKVTV